MPIKNQYPTIRLSVSSGVTQSMPRDIPVGNGQMLVTFDQHYQIRDLYFPHVGQENHAGGGPCQFGIWSVLPPNQTTEGDRRRKRLFWTHQGWQLQQAYEPDTLATDVTMTHEALKLRMHCCDVVDFHRPLLVRRVEVVNLFDAERTVHLFHHQDFGLFGTKVGDTVYFDPQLDCLVHYRQQRYLMASWCDEQGRMHIDQYATGLAGFRGAEGTWRDAEDGELGHNTIAQGAVDSTMMMKVLLEPLGRRVVYMVIGAGYAYEDLIELGQFLRRERPMGVIDRTKAYWRLWLAAARSDFPKPSEGGPRSRVVDLFKRSLLVLRTQINNSGAIIAANDSDIMQFQRDTYSYLWPRDGALVAAAMDAAGFPDVARSFYLLCSQIITEQGYFLHKYNPDGSPGSSWHPWVSEGHPQLPIQEDETALVLWALWRHYVRYRDIEFVRPLWVDLITRAADFLVRFRDPDTHLPLSSYDLWEERWGIHAFTVATVYGGLDAAMQFATCFGDTRRAAVYADAAAQMRESFCKYMWSQEHDRFLRRIVPLDRSRTARQTAEVLAGQAPTVEQADHAKGNGQWRSQYEFDLTIDSAMYAACAFGMLSPHDERMEKTMAAIESRLWVKTRVGGLARYEGDHYHRISDDVENIPGNPWFICTLWLAEWKIARASNIDQLREALPIFEWVASHALPSGVLAEQVHPETNAPLSVSPLTWSHAAVVAAIEQYLSKLDEMTACVACGQPRQRVTKSASTSGLSRPEPALALGEASLSKSQ